MSRPRVLVTGTGLLGVGEGLIHCLEEVADSYQIYAANIDESATAIYTCEQGYILPAAPDPNYSQVVFDLCRNQRIDFLIPGSEPELSKLASCQEKFSSIGCSLLANPPDVIAIGDDKIATYDFLSKKNLPTPQSEREVSLQAAEKLGWPVILKPRMGGGAKHVYKIKDEKEFEIVKSWVNHLGVEAFLQEFVGSMDEEFTASSLSDLNGLFIGSFAARRTLAGGATATVEVNEYPEVQTLARQVAEALGARGPINIQARVHNGQLTVFEINPRFSGSAPFRAKCGFNEPHLLIQSIIHGTPVSFDPPQKNVFGVRSFKETLFQQDRKKKLVRVKH